MHLFFSLIRFFERLLLFFKVNFEFYMHVLAKKIDTITVTCKEKIASVHTVDELEQVRITYIARKGLFHELLEEFKQLSLPEKQELGPLLQKERKQCEELFEQKKEQLERAHAAAQEAKKSNFDPTAYMPNTVRGGLHPLTLITHRLVSICTAMGFEVAHGPELEREQYNFDALNIGPDHPARDFWDTLWVHPPLLLRTHTSSVQIHAMKKHKAPLAVIAPGRCYRHEATDATHDYMFMQLEGMVIDKNISLSNLLATAQELFGTLFGKEKITMRTRPSYFPFVEPGIEIDIECPFCQTGCSTCKHSRWIEIGGAGLIHPAVLQAVDIDPAVYSGFAFGLGLTRLAMLLYHINDIRLLHTNNYEFLKQF